MFSTPARLALLATLLLPLTAAAFDPVTVQTRRVGEAFEVDAQAALQAGAERGWAVLTAYERYAEFIPDMTASRVVRRDGDRLEVEQRGRMGGAPFFSLAVETRLEIVEHPRSRITLRAISGSFRELSGEYRLEPRAGGVLLRYRGRIEPGFELPPVVGAWMFEWHVDRSFRALVDEIERRGAPPTEPSPG